MASLMVDFLEMGWKRSQRYEESLDTRRVSFRINLLTLMEFVIYPWQQNGLNIVALLTSKIDVTRPTFRGRDG
jgi:hypothetical protein